MTLSDYLEHHLFPVRLFPRTETGGFTEVTKSMYVLLRNAVRDKSDAITVTEMYITWLKDGQVIEQILIVERSVWFTTTHRQELERIVSYDEDVRKHLQLISDSKDILAYNIVANV